MSLPEDFLTQLEQYGELSQGEREVFVAIFSHGKSRVEVTQALHISDSNLSTRLSGIYKKFKISGNGPVKENRLREYLSKRYSLLKASASSTPHDSDSNINALVQEVREKVKPGIQERCSTMRVLDMTQPIGLNDIYTNVNILEKITRNRRIEVSELLKVCNSDDFERFGLSEIAEERVPGLEAVKKYTKLMILGKPGAGKTTFMKYVAMQCIAGNFQADRVPIFVTLKDFADSTNKSGLLEYICQQLSNGAETQNSASMQKVIAHGRALILLDGLDEVREDESNCVLKEIRNLSDKNSDNHFVMTCRIAAQEYIFNKFTDVEVADFDNEQMATFANKWFKGKVVKAETFLKRIQDNQRIRELATNPLLLTLLCLVFEESGDFPANRSELYKEGLDALLKKWDAKRGIERYQIYKKLSVQRKEDLLSKIALTTFEKGDYFFKQKAAELYIKDYIRNLPDANTELEVLQLDSEKVLQSIEAQHGLLVERAKGIYSFSHLTFHEYFTAREIIVGNQSSEEALQNLVNHITERRWREVFLLAVGMSPSADRLLLLMKKQVDLLLEDDQKLQEFLIWLREKSDSLDVPYKSAAVRAFYFKLDRDLDRDLARDLDRGLVRDLDRALARALDLDLVRVFALDLVLDHALDLDRARDLALDHVLAPLFAYARDRARDRDLKEALQELKEQLPVLNDEEKIFKQWWKDNGWAWIEQLRVVTIKYCNIGHDWQFSKQQKELLQRYYDANLLLINCLNSDCYVSREVRQEIEDTLLLPIAEIEKHRHPA
ncbi:NACHT domain-containing protein [Microcoleus sp. FACHB-68]|uniref:NACHT C-terminal helical domain 2-containing protein n=1 Tax=Microcoleus sp. FACHB-68 TaxID=2692826 RepID=UPI0016882C60|nr:NACHT domain-containing protein [Microcoleus sp. FACHB-68]MBD1938227.1 NACHT domain-containing protein [Microcoleus sp. FACHB-68]